MPSTGNLVYLVYGRGPHTHEAIFSILSALRYRPRRRSPYRILVYTDDPTPFVGLPIATEILDAEQLSAWTGPDGYIHRRKALLLDDLLRRYPAPTVLIDTDTYFARSPARLFDRIAPGRAIMHALEGPVHSELARWFEQMEFINPAGGRMKIPTNAPMWNSGVLGLHPADRPMILDAIGLMDDIYAKTRFRTTEQFALGYVLGQRITLQETRDVVFHYWDMDIREPFWQVAPRLLRDSSHLPPARQLRRCWPYRPRLGRRVEFKMQVKRILQAARLMPREEMPAISYGDSQASLPQP